MTLPMDLSSSSLLVSTCDISSVVSPVSIPQSLLGSTERIVQEIDSVEYGLTDIQEYYANTGMEGGLTEELL